MSASPAGRKAGLGVTNAATGTKPSSRLPARSSAPWFRPVSISANGEGYRGALYALLQRLVGWRSRPDSD
jgi:hypothetical protein